jgi:endonuclease/exonuclease/phosphatase family metal-dependent hydrolase
VFKPFKIIGSVLFLSILSSCVNAPKPVFSKGYEPEKQSVTVMTYNVENLFDTENDPNKNDEAFLPLETKGESVKAACRAENDTDYRVEQCISGDWDEHRLKLKMKRLAHVIRQVKGGRGPDVLILEEVENQAVVERWRKEYLADLGYKPAIVLEGPDERGIDVGFLTKLDIEGEPKLHLQKFVTNEKLKEIRPTRGILEVTVKLPDGSLLTVFGVHFPSQGGPNELRRQALLRVNELQSTLPPGRMSMVAGDFNITSVEEFKERYTSKLMQPTWGVSHKLGCNDCPGTYYYGRDRSWSFFDIILLSKNMLNDGDGPWKVLPESIRLENNSKYQMNPRTGGPGRFNHRGSRGVSDHWPIALEIVTR